MYKYSQCGTSYINANLTVRVGRFIWFMKLVGPIRLLGKNKSRYQVKCGEFDLKYNEIYQLIK